MDPGDQLIDHYTSQRPVSQELYQRAESVLAGRMVTTLEPSVVKRGSGHE